ncbi:MAG: DoxX family protein [Muribaculaceae bacterium]|nr:DoxX family protein [Muribaculaceae bacterium]MDE7368188.1 DoxX family protein [Muribaculaceae bacterium]
MELSARKRYRLLIFTVLALRLLAGGLFIFSGFVKAVDLWGFIFKIDEYFAIANFVAPRSVSLAISLIVAGFEFVGGVLLLSGSYRRWSVILMTALMAGFDVLTLYLWITDPIPDCGCFGDAWVLSNGATFLKNVILTAMLVFLLFYNKKVRYALFKPAVQWIAIVASVYYIVSIAMVGYNVQPQIDFRPYPVGRQLVADSDDIENIKYIYTDGKNQKTFTADKLPDEGWEFVSVVEDSNHSGNDIFSVYDGDEDISDEVFTKVPRHFLLVIPELNRADISFSYFVNNLYRFCKKNNIKFTALLATNEAGLDRWRDLSLASYDCFTAEDTSLKELSRGNMSLVYLENGTIKWKSTVSSVYDKDIEKLEKKYGADFTMKMAPTPISIPRMTFWYIVILAILTMSKAIINFIYQLKAKSIKTNK